MTNYQNARLRDKLENKICELMDGVIDQLDIDDIIDDTELADAISDQVTENLKDSLLDMVSDIVNDLM